MTISNNDNKCKITDSVLKVNQTKFKTTLYIHDDNIEYKGTIIFVHGFGESKKLYSNFFQILTEKGYNIFFYTQNGIDSNDDKNSFTITKNDVIFDLDFIIEHVINNICSGEKIALMGVLMGGSTVLNYGIKGNLTDKLSCIVACSPFITLAQNLKLNPLTRFCLSIGSKCLPNLKYRSKLNYKDITSNPAYLEILKFGNKSINCSLKQLNDMFEKSEILLQPDFVSNFTTEIPLLVLHSKEDKITDIKGTETFVSLLNKSVSVNFLNLDHGYHSLFLEQEPNFSVIFTQLTDFFNSNFHYKE